MEVVGGDGAGAESVRVHDGDLVLVADGIHPALQALLRDGDPFDGSVRVQSVADGGIGVLRGWRSKDSGAGRFGDTSGGLSSQGCCRVEFETGSHSGRRYNVMGESVTLRWQRLVTSALADCSRCLQFFR